MLRSRLTIVILLIVAACSQNPEPDTNAQASLRVEIPTITVDGDAVPAGDTVSVSAGQRVQVVDSGFGSIEYDDVIEFEVFGSTNLVAPDPTTLPAGLSAVLAGGHLHVTVLDPVVELELQLGEQMERTLRTIDPQTEFVVCQSAKGVTCLMVLSGSVQWEGDGDVYLFTEGQATFAQPGMPPLSPNCPPINAYDLWRNRYSRGEGDQPLTQLVGAYKNSGCQPGESPNPPTTQEQTSTTEPDGDDVAAEESLPSGEGMTRVQLDQPEIGTADFGRNPEEYRQPEQLSESFDFFIDTEATTNSDFRAWLVDEAGNDAAKWADLAPDAWLARPPGSEYSTQATYLEDEKDLPVIEIRWQTAADYCRYHDKRLPTEIEWELAAVNGYLTDIEQERQDWVDKPEDYEPSTPSERRVLRGTTRSWEPDLYYRLEVEDTPEGDVARARAGVRCAADKVQPGTAGGIAAGTLVVDENFEKSTSGWPTISGEATNAAEPITIGYHPESDYHVEPHAQHTQVVVLHQASDDMSAGLSVTTNAFVESTEETTAGPDAYRFGIVVGDESGRLLALTIKPNTVSGRYDWCLGPTSDELEAAVEEMLVAGTQYAWAVPEHRRLRHRGESCGDGYGSGVVEPTDDFRISRPMELKLSVGSGVATVHIAGEELDQVEVGLDPTAYGFFVEIFHMGKAHIHYEDIVVTTP